MKFGGATACAALLLMCAFFLAPSVIEAKKTKKPSAPQWKSSSMPYKNTRFPAEKEGHNLKLDCKAQGHPKPNIKWVKDGQTIRKNTNQKMAMKKFGLTLSNVTTDMSGNYTCVVKNKYGALEWTFIVDISGSVWPLVVEGPKNATQMVGSNAAFQCFIRNDPNGTIRWKKIIIKKDGRKKSVFLPDPENPEVLKLENIDKKDEGEYHCMAGNINGLKYSAAWLNVIEPVVLPPTDPSHSSGNRDKDMIMPSGNDNTNGNQNGGFLEPFDPNNPNAFDFGPDYFYTTTKRPRKNKGRGKNGRRKNKKNKNKNSKTPPTLPPFSTLPSTVPTEFSSLSTYRFYDFESTTPKIWSFEDDNVDNDSDGFSDTRYNPTSGDSAEDGNLANSKADDEGPAGGDISAWKIYTIVGAVAGVVLLMGLVAITIAVCCPKQEGGSYKSTPV